MTNRQWLETLSNEDFEKETCDTCKQCIYNANLTKCMGRCIEGRNAWLVAKHKEEE